MVAAVAGANSSKDGAQHSTTASPPAAGSSTLAVPSNSTALAPSPTMGAQSGRFVGGILHEMMRMDHKVEDRDADIRLAAGRVPSHKCLAN